MADIKAGTTVVVDRYYYSGCVYSAAKDNPNLDLQWARKSDEGLPRPDVCVFLDIAAEEAERRGSFGAERYEKKDMQHRVRQLFGRLRQAAEKDDFVVVDGGNTQEGVALEILLAVERAFRQVDEHNMPLRAVEPW